MIIFNLKITFKNQNNLFNHKYKSFLNSAFSKANQSYFYLYIN